MPNAKCRMTNAKTEPFDIRHWTFGIQVCLVLCVAFAAPAAAQQTEPIGPFAADVRGIFARHKAEPSVATDLGVDAGNLPSRSVGLVARAHVYPWRGRKITLGVGGEFALGRGSRTLDL